MNTSILNTIKEMVGVESTDTNFDVELIVLINTAIVVLYQIGVGTKGFKITGSTETWSDYITSMDEMEMVKNHIYQRVKRRFDPPSSSNVATSMDNEIKEMEWRLNVAVDDGGDDDE